MENILEVPLKLVIEGKQYETFDQYKTGAELKQIAGIPLKTELYLSISKPYKDELIENDNRVNLARPETEYFFVKKKLDFTINKKPFIWYKQFIRGIQIRELGNISEQDLIYLDIKGDWEDDLIENDEVVDLAREGKENFISVSRPYEVVISVNGRDKTWNEKMISYDQVVTLAREGKPDNGAEKAYLVTYFDGPAQNQKGELAKGVNVFVTNKMMFNAAPTDKS
jgi:hypothetical protein